MVTVEEKAIFLLRFSETKSVIKMPRRYRTQYGRDPASDNAIRRWLKRFLETRSVFAAIETVTLQMLENTWREIEYRLDTLRATKGTSAEATQHSAVLIL
jgi:hypothetical protein